MSEVSCLVFVFSYFSERSCSATTGGEGDTFLNRFSLFALQGECSQTDVAAAIIQHTRTGLLEFVKADE